MKKSIRRQITGIFMTFLLGTIALIVVFNMSFMEKYYLESKKKILIEGYDEICNGIQCMETSEMTQFASANNLEVLLANWNHKPTQMLYVNMREEDAMNLAARLFGDGGLIVADGDIQFQLIRNFHIFSSFLL